MSVGIFDIYLNQDSRKARESDPQHEARHVFAAPQV
jgi:hypothetical protein